MRKVRVMEAYRPEGYAGGPLPIREVGTGVFHQWGVDYEAFEVGAGSYSVAIVEMPDGTVRTPQACMVRFVEGMK